MKMKMLWVGTSTNPKTGSIPQGYVGEEKSEARASCAGCPMLGNGCYYHQGSAGQAHNSMIRANKRDTTGQRYKLETALGKSVRIARYVRGAVGGDPNVFDRATVLGWIEQIRAHGMKGLLLYTHFWETKGAHLKGLAMASCDSLEDADRAIAAGWRVAVILPASDPTSKRTRLKSEPWAGEKFVTPNGHRVVVCPAQRPELRKDCNTCGLCDPTSHDGVKAIGFLEH
jgi:hypothetical protein